MKNLMLSFAAACAAMVSFTLKGELAWNAGDYTPEDWVPAGNNLLAGITADFSGKLYTESKCSENPATLTDGVVPGASCEYGKIFGIADNSSLTWDLGVASDIKALNVYTRWGDGGRSGIGISSVEVMYDGSTSWTTLEGSALSYQVGQKSGASLYGKLSDSNGGNIAESVVKLRVNLGAQDNSGTGYVEFEAVSDGEPPPTPAACESSLYSLSGSSQTFSAKVSNYGRYSETATMTLELSADADFSGVIASDPVALSGDGDLNVAKLMTVSGLQPNTLYYSRLKVVNEKGLVVYSEQTHYFTKALITLGGVGYESVEGGYSVIVAISDLSVASATVDLFANGALVGSKTVTGPGEVLFDVKSPHSSVALKAVVTGGQLVLEKQVTAERGKRCIAFSRVSDHASPQTAVVVEVGDQIVLPLIAGVESYVLLNPRFASLNDDTLMLTAKEPGIVGVEYYGSDGGVSTLCVLILEKDADRSRVFVYNTGTDWLSPSTWTDIYGNAVGRVPTSSDDIVYIDPPSALTLKGDNVTVGQVYIGLHENKTKYGNNQEIVLALSAATSGGTFTLKRTDKKPARIQMCPNHLSGTWSFQFGSSATTFKCTSDVIVDFGWNQAGESSVLYGQNVSKLKFSNATVDIPGGNWFRLCGDTPYGWGGFNQSDVSTSSSRLTGAGEFVHTGRGPMTFSLDASAFTGTLVEAGGPHSGGHDRSRNLMMDTDKLGSSSLVLAGYPFRSDYRNFDTAKSVSYFGSGAWHGWGSRGMMGNRLPPAGMILRGGFGDFVQEQQDWGSSVQSNYTARMTLDRGFTYLAVSGHTDAGAYPYNFFQADAIAATKDGYGTLYINESNCANGSVDSYRSGVFFPSFNSDPGAFGDGSDCTVSETYSVRPNMVSRYKSDDGYDLTFASVTTGGRVVRPIRTDSALADSDDATLNAFSKGKDATLTKDVVTVNSLVINNNGKSLNLGENKKLKIVSGGLILNGTKSGIGGLAAGAAAGSLEFGDTAYVWATSFSSGEPNTIAAQMTAPKGFVSAMPGHLQIVGDQTGIDGEIVVNAGTLYLGAKNGSEGVTIDVPVRVYAGANLSVTTTNVLDKQVVCLDDVAAHGGKIIIPDGAEAKCLKLYTRDSVLGDETWISLSRGTYGATGSGAEFIDDEHFTGTGVLIVRRDDKAVGFKLHVR